MPFNVAEVAPAGPAFVEMLGPLLIIAGLIFALGCATLIKSFVESVLGALAGIFSFLPFFSGVTVGAIRSFEQWLVNGLGHGISKIEGSIGHQWHNLARVAHYWWNVTVRMAHATWEIAHALGRFALTFDVHHLLRDLRKLVHIGRATATTALHRVIRLEHTVTRTLPREIRSARALAREAEDGVARLWAWTRSIGDNPAIVAAVATAIAALGLVGIDLLRCAESGNVASKRGCSVWTGLDDLLGLLALGIAAGEFETLVHEAQDLTHAATTVFDDVFGLSR
jgi:hypothetical protein